jgi:hypothetical protein
VQAISHLLLWDDDFLHEFAVSRNGEAHNLPFKLRPASSPSALGTSLPRIEQSGKHRFFIHVARFESREHLQRDIVCFSGIRTRTKQGASFFKKLPERSELLGVENA